MVGWYFLFFGQIVQTFIKCTNVALAHNGYAYAVVAVLNELNYQLKNNLDMKDESNNTPQTEAMPYDAMLATGRILHLTLKRKWYDMIASGEKTEEYREIKPYWTTRLKDFLVKKPFDYIIFKNGYGKDAPTMKVELKNIDFGTSNLKWADREEKCYVLYLGKVVWNKIKKEQNLQETQKPQLNIGAVSGSALADVDEQELRLKKRY